MDKYPRALTIHTRRLLLVVACALLARCTNSDSRGNPDTGRSEVGVQAGHLQIDHPFSSSAAGPIVPSLAQCVRMELDLQRDGAAFTRSAVRVRNACRTPVAILTAPVELRIRNDPHDRFPFQSMSAAHATFYVAPKIVGLPAEMFLGDGGKRVHAAPQYSTVPAGAEMSIAIVHADRLMLPSRREETSVALVTFAVPLEVSDGRAGAFDLAKDVAAFDLDAAAPAPFLFSRRVQQLGASTDF